MEHKFFSDHLREYLKENESKLIEGLSEIVAQPSVSSTGEGVSKCCELIVKKMKAIGMDVQTYPIEPHSVIIGKIGEDPSKKTVLIYAHYDVQPQGDLTQWRTPPLSQQL